MRLVYFSFKHCEWAFSCSYQRWKKKRMEIVTRNKWENISRLFTRLEESWSGRKPFSQDCSPCQTEFFLQANFLLFTQFNDLLKLNLVCYKVFSLGETKVSSPSPLLLLKKFPLMKWPHGTHFSKVLLPSLTWLPLCNNLHRVLYCRREDWFWGPNNTLYSGWRYKNALQSK